MTLKALRTEKQLTQRQCAAYLGVPLRTYQLYEQEGLRVGTLKYDYMVEKLARYGYLDETHGLLTQAQIQHLCAPVFERYGVEFCYLFGSYAKQTATERSDVDLLVSSTLKGIRFYELLETLRETLKKQVEVLTVEQVINNPVLLTDILKDGVKIYG